MSDQLMPQIIAHRGASAHAPENTLAAIQAAADAGATWIEIDVNISRDGIAVLHHDDGLERCTDGSGLVIEKDLAALRDLDSGSWFNQSFQGEQIATLEECIALANRLSLGINLEIKPCSGWEIPTTQRIAKTITAADQLPPMVISSFSHIALIEVKKHLPDIPRGSLFLVAPPDWQALTDEVAASTIHLHANSLLNRTDVDAFHQHGLGVYCYTVNTTEEATEIFNLGVDGVFTNYPQELLALNRD
ncbi:MAG: glycerophosphodiester phosphodiesterase family protein [Pseudomonadota bacterium]